MVWPDSSVLLDDVKNGNVGHNLQFKHLPLYAEFLLKNKVKDYTLQQLQLMRSLNVPLFKYFEFLPEKQLIERGEIATKKILSSLAQNKAREFINDSVQTWLSNHLPLISKEQVVPEDITLISFIRRKTMRDFLSFYTNDFPVFRDVMEEVDIFTSELDTICFKTLMILQQDLYKQTQALAHVGHWEWDLSSGKLTWSDEVFRIYELELQSEIPPGLASFNHPDDAAGVLEEMKRSRETLQPHNFFYRIILKNGKEKFLHAKGQVQANEKGQPAKMFGTLQDVTMQKLIERELEEKQTFIHKITNLTPSLIAVYNINTGKYLFVSPALKTILGYDSQLVLDQGMAFFLNIIHPDDIPVITEKNNKALEMANKAEYMPDRELITEFAYRLKHRNGQYRWMHTYGTVFSRDKNNAVEMIINISVDVTEQVQTSEQLKTKNEELRRNEERYHKMIDEVEDYAILLLSKDGIIQNWNKGAEKIEGYKADEIIGKSFRLFYTPEDLQKKVPENFLKEALTKGKASLQGWRVRKDGTNFWGNVVLTALHDDRNDIIGFTKVTHDLTERKEAENATRENALYIEQKNKELERKNKELESFSYIASHDLQEPLRKIMLFSKRIEENDQLTDSSKDFFNRIINASTRMQTLIDALLNFASIHTHDDKYELINLTDIAEEVKKDLSEIIEEKKVALEIFPLPAIKVIRLQFQQLFTNIITNAIKYSRPHIHPHIQISTTLVHSEEIHPDSPEKEFHRISITDNGIGFEEQYAGRIFEPFQRLHGKKDYAGAGIGLSICKKIVLNHNGFINATSKPGKGSTFNIYLPAVSTENKE